MRLQRQLKTKKRRRRQFNTCKQYNKRCNSKTKTHDKRKRSHTRKRVQSGGTLDQVINRLNGVGYATTDLERIKKAFKKSNGNVGLAVDMVVQAKLSPADAFANFASPQRTTTTSMTKAPTTTTTRMTPADAFANFTSPQRTTTSMTKAPTPPTTTTTRMTPADAFANFASPQRTTTTSMTKTTTTAFNQFVDILNSMGVYTDSTNNEWFNSLLKQSNDNVPKAVESYFAQITSAAAAPISAAPISAAPISAAPISASGALTPPPPNQAYAKTPMYLKNPDTFVERYVQSNHIPLAQNEIYRVDPRRTLLEFSQVFRDWRVMQTVGDGNCLTHAFLQCLSPTYGKILGMGYTNKTAVARAFRLDFANKSDLAVNKNEYNGLRDLSDVQITDYSRLFNVITVVFEQRDINPLESSPEFVNPIFAYNLTQHSKPNDTVIFIHGDGMHYSSIMLPNSMFAMTLDEARKIPALVAVLTPL